MRFPLFIVVAIGVLLSSGHLRAQPFEALQHGLDIHAPDGLVVQNADLAEAMRKLHIPSVDVALIERGRLRCRTFSAPPRTSDLSGRVAVEARDGRRRLASCRPRRARSRSRRERLSDRLARARERFHARPSGDVAPIAEHDGRHRRSRLSRLRARTKAADAATNPRRHAAGEFAACARRGDPRQPLRLFGRRLRDCSSAHRSNDQDEIPGCAGGSAAAACRNGEQLFSATAAWRTCPARSHRPRRERQRIAGWLARRARARGRRIVVFGDGPCASVA